MSTEPLQNSGSCDCCNLAPAAISCVSCQERSYCSKACQERDWNGGHSDKCTHLSNVYIAEDCAKGKILRSAKSFERGEKIFDEMPLLRVPLHDDAFERTLALFSKVSKSARQAIFSLFHEERVVADEKAESGVKLPYGLSWEEACRFSTILRLNGFEQISYVSEYAAIVGSSRKGDGTEGWRLLYRIACRMSHSCDPNCQRYIIAESGKICFTALKHIDKDEEICCTYLQCGVMLRSTELRRPALLDKYSFVCNCPRCIQTPEKNRVALRNELIPLCLRCEKGKVLIGGKPGSLTCSSCGHAVLDKHVPFDLEKSIVKHILLNVDENLVVVITHEHLKEMSMSARRRCIEGYVRNLTVRPFQGSESVFADHWTRLCGMNECLGRLREYFPSGRTVWGYRLRIRVLRDLLRRFGRMYPQKSFLWEGVPYMMTELAHCMFMVKDFRRAEIVFRKARKWLIAFHGLQFTPVGEVDKMIQQCKENTAAKN